MRLLREHFWIVELSYLALIAPVALFPTHCGLLLLLGIPFLWLLRWRLSGHFVPETPLNAAILLLLIMVLVSLFVTYDMNGSLPKITGVVWGVALYFGFVAAIDRSYDKWQAALIFFVIGGLSLVPLALIGIDWSQPGLEGIRSIVSVPELIQQLPGVSGGFSPNQVAGTLLWFVPLAATLFLAGLWQASRDRSLRWQTSLFLLALLSLAVLGALVITLSISFSAWFGLLLAVVIVISQLLVLNRKRSPARIASLIGLGLLGFAVMMAVSIQTAVLPRLVASLPQIEGRQLHWQRAIKAIEMYPVTGLGMNMYRQIVHVLYPQFLIFPERDIPHAHNMYLQVALDVGLPGLIAYLALIITSFYLLYKLWHMVTDIWQRGFVIGCAIGLLSHAVYGLTDAVTLGAKPGFAYWILLGLIFSLYRLTMSPAIHSDKSLDSIE